VSTFSPIFFWKSENPFQKHLCKQNPKPFPTENSLSKPSQAIQETFDEKSRLVPHQATIFLLGFSFREALRFRQVRYFLIARHSSLWLS